MNDGFSVEDIKSARNARHIDAIIDGSEGLYGSRIWTSSGNIFVISDNASHNHELVSFLENLTPFQLKYVSRPRYLGGRGDCKWMAKAAMQPWTKEGEQEIRAPLADGILHYRFTQHDHPMLEFDQHL